MRHLLPARRRGVRRRGGTALVALLGLTAASCSSIPLTEDALEPPPVTRDVGSVPPTTAPPPLLPVEQPATTDPVDAGGGGGQVGEPSATSVPPEPLDYSIAWESRSDRVDVGTLTVPLDYADPQGATIDLFVARHAADADQRIGVLLANNGGPGAAASTIALNATSWFAPEITERFDVVSWDPRGTGESSGVDCIDDADYDRIFSSADVTPEFDEERERLVLLAQEFAAGCVERAGDVLQYIGTNNSARDMDAIRQALGEPQVSYFGFSYGSELGGTWATLFPGTVRAAVFDGASDPTADSLERTRQQWVGFEAALNTFLAECSADSSCAFNNGGNAEAAFDELFAALDEEPLDGPEGRADVNLAVGVTGVVQAMYSDRFWPALERALDDALQGDGDGLLRLQDAYFQRNSDGSYSNLLEAFQAISCADDPDRPTVAESDAEAEALIGVAPRLFPYTTGSYFCTFFPPALDPRIDITGVGAGPIVVVGTTGDPSTPLASSRAMADALEDGRFVVVEANQHTGYRVNGCIDDVIHEYLVRLAAPSDETVCG